MALRLHRTQTMIAAMTFESHDLMLWFLLERRLFIRQRLSRSRKVSDSQGLALPKDYWTKGLISNAVLSSTSQRSRHELNECMGCAYAYLATQWQRAEVAYANLLRARARSLSLALLILHHFHIFEMSYRCEVIHVHGSCYDIFMMALRPHRAL